MYVTFPTAFWQQQDKESANPQDTTSSLPGFTLFAAPSYAPDTNPHRWPQHAVNLAALPHPHAQPTLQFFVFGDCARHIAALVSEKSVPAEASTGSHASTDTGTNTTPKTEETSQTNDHATKALIEFFQPYFSRLPNYDPDSPSCRPTAALATAWAADEYAGYGSYTNWTVGCERCGGGCGEGQAWVS